MTNDSRNIHPEMNKNLNKEFQSDFYNTLAHYKPLCCTSHQSSPLSTNDIDEQKQERYVAFLINQGWWKPFICILFMNGIYILTSVRFVFDTRTKYVDSQDSSQPVISHLAKSQNFSTMLILCVVSLVLINVSYFLTQFLNPGIRNLEEVSDEEFGKAKKVQFCQKCHQYKTENFTHCLQCQVCVWNYDHHCGFFGKCVGGRAQFWAFLLFMVSVTDGFLILLGCVTVQLGAAS